VLLLEVDEQELVARLLGRAAKEGRSDDNLESIKQRLKVYHDQTAPLVAYYERQGVVRRIPGMGAVDDIQARVREGART
jgi:adenylate kinase